MYGGCTTKIGSNLNTPPYNPHTDQVTMTITQTKQQDQKLKKSQTKVQYQKLKESTATALQTVHKVEQSVHNNDLRTNIKSIIINVDGKYIRYTYNEYEIED